MSMLAGALLVLALEVLIVSSPNRLATSCVSAPYIYAYRNLRREF
jgi:hypothetical protein